jgi:Peptidase A4 family
MLTKRLRILLVLAALPALVQAPSKNSLLNSVIQLNRNAPMQFHRVAPDGTVESNNWAGYAVTGSGFHDAEASWIQPKADCSKTPNTYAVHWVGIDGYSSATVEQTGTIIECVGTTAEYGGWWEFYPVNSIQIISGFKVSPGNKIDASVTYNGSDFTVTLRNETTGHTFTHSGPVSGAKRVSAEWIAEAPSSSGGILPLSDFGTAKFGAAYTAISGTNDAKDSTTSGPIKDFGKNVHEIKMVGSGGTPVKAQPTALDTAGTSFEVTWKHE